MDKILGHRNILSYIITISLLLSIPIFTFGESTQDFKEELSVVIQGEFGPASKDTYVTGMVQDDYGNTYIVGVTQSQFGEKDSTDKRERVFLAKFDENLDMVDYTVLVGDSPTIIDYEGYDFAKEEKVYLAGNQSYNSPIAIDGNGNIYIVTQEKVSRSLTTSIEYIMWEFDDCICDLGCDEEECDWGGTTDCPVCNAFREFEAGFDEGSSLEYVLYKFDNSLGEIDSFTIASAQGVNSYNNRVVAIEIDDEGNIFLGGGTEVDLGFIEPVYDFSYFDADPTGSGKEMEDTRGFIVKINPGMDQIIASTYLGGPLAETGSYSGPNCYVTAIEKDGGYIYVAGIDGGGKIPSVNSPREKTKNDSDVYIARLDEDLRIDQAVYYGGTSGDDVSQLKVTDSGVYIGGHTTSSDIPTHSSAYQSSLNISTGIYRDAFVACFSKDLEMDESFAATYIGGEQREDLFDMDVDDYGNVYIIGETYGAFTYPTTDGTSNSNGRIFITKLNEDFSDLITSTVVGTGPGNGSEQGRAIKVDEDGIIVAGQTDLENTNTVRPFVSKYNTLLSHSKVMEIKASPSGTKRNPVFLGTGDTIDIEVIFDSYVVVDTTDGNPRIKLNLGENSYAEYVSGSGTNVLNFQYTIVEGDTTNGNTLNCYESALDLNGSTILPRSGGIAEDINLNLPSDGLSKGYIYVNTVPINVDLISSSIGQGVYGVDTVIPITVRFMDRISSVDTTNGVPELLLNNGGKAVFVEKSKAKDTDLIFNYTVGDNQTVDELNIASEDALSLNGAIIKDYYGIEPDLKLPSPDDSQRTLKGKGIKISNNAAKILSVTTTLEEGVYTAGQEIPITLNFDKAINKKGIIKLAINSKKDYGMISHDGDVENAQSITFNYVVEEGDITAYGYLDYTNESLMLERGAELTSVDGEPVALTMPKIGSGNSLSAAKISIDTEEPFVQYNYKKPSKSIFKAGEEIILEAQFNEEVYLRGDTIPYVEVNYTTPGEEKKARFDYIGIDPNNPKKALFKYIVKEEDSLKEERIDYDGWTIAPEDSFMDRAGNKASLELPYNTSWFSSSTWKLTFDSISPEWDEGSLVLTYDEEKEYVKLEWPDAKDDNSGISKYYIYRAIKDGDSQELDSKSSSYNSYEDSSIELGTTYIYSIYAEDKAGNISEALVSEEITIPGESSDDDPLENEKPIIENVTEDDLYIELGDMVPANEVPEPEEVLAIDAYGEKISPEKITREIVLETEPDKILDEIDTSIVGTYIVTYTVEDARGNVVVVNKKVIVYQEDDPIEDEGAYLVAIDESEDYKILGDCQVPTIININEEGKEIEFRANISPITSYKDGFQTVLFIHMRGNKMINLCLIEEQDFIETTPVNGSFVMKSGDKVLIYIVDNIDGIKGNGTRILFK